MSYYNNKGNNGIYFLRIVVAFLLICVSIITIYVVISKVGDLKIAEGITVKGEDVKFFIKTDESQNDMFFVTDDKGLRCKKPDGSFAREEWIEKNGELFYFDTSSYGKNGELKLQGQVYTLENGKLKKIIKDKTYGISEVDGYFSAVDSTSFIVYLENEKNEDGYYPIRYKRYGDNEEDYLGTENDRQYSSAYMTKVNENMIYYLAIGSKTTYAGRLYRMKPNGSLREGIGTSVQGYIVLSSDVVYYYDGVRIIKAKSWKEEEVKVLEAEEETLPLPDGETDVLEPTAKNNIFGDIFNAIPLPINNKNNDEKESIDESKEKESTIKAKDDSNIKIEDAIIVEPLPIPKETVIDKEDVKSKQGYTTTKENAISQNIPPASGKPSISTNAPGVQ